MNPVNVLAAAGGSLAHLDPERVPPPERFAIVDRLLVFDELTEGLGPLLRSVGAESVDRLGKRGVDRLGKRGTASKVGTGQPASVGQSC